MKLTTTALLGVTSVIAASLAFTTLAPGARAAVGSGEDRQISSPTAWWSYGNITAAQVSSTLTANHARLTDIKLSYSGNSPRFTVTEVANSGAYASGWYWYYGMSVSSLVQTAVTNNARITTLSCTVHSSATECAAIMIANTGANAEGWSAWIGTPSYINSKITSSTRMVSFARVQGSNYYTAVFGSNTGTDHLTWWWYYGASLSYLMNSASSNHARIVDLDRNSDGTYNAVLYANPAGTTWYAYTNYSLGGLVDKAVQLGQRLFDVTPYSSGGTTRYVGVMVNNSDALTSKVIGTLAGKVPNGNWGFELAQVGGPVLTGLETTRAFEPASTLKVLYHYKSILAEQAGTAHDSNLITYHYDPAHPTDGDICPDAFSSTKLDTLDDADALMMQQSDNRMTRGILEKYGKSAMLAEASHLGMTHTQINHNIGCPTSTTHNYTSLSDLAKLYSAYQQGTDITATKWRSQFRIRMLNEANYPSALNSICTIVNQEATSLGKSSLVATQFCQNITWTAKGGSYQYGNADTDPISWANGSLTTLPVKSGSTITPKAYFYGDYFDEVSFAGKTAKNALASARTTAFQAALRPYIRAALATW